MTHQGWSWDPSPYAGAAAFYPVGRVAYPPELAQRLADALHLDGSVPGACSTSAAAPAR